MNALSVTSHPIVCYCQGHCPDHSHNGTCTLAQGGYCFAFVQEVVDTENNKLEAEWSYGCLAPEETGYLQCQSYLTPHLIPRSIRCCTESFCNMHLRPMYEPTRDDEFVTYDGPTIHSYLYERKMWMLLPLPILLLVFSILLFILIRQIKSRKKRSVSSNKVSEQGFDYEDHKGYTDVDGLEDDPIPFDGMMDSSGGRVPLLVERSVARDIDWNKVGWTGRGRFGCVMVAPYKGTRVAVKIFQTTEESSWLREQAIYTTPLLRHENILGFISADIRGTGGQTQMVLITDYHDHGSLYDFISTRVLDEETTIKMMWSIASGLTHLHTEISGRQSKPAIAHRDIKSKNVLVKSDLTCCLADFGLSVTYESSTKRLNRTMDNPKVGTKRYMSPEILDDSIDADDFESYKRADVYSFSLVLWEMARRCVLPGQGVDDYEVPYQGLVPNDPSFEDMKILVCDKKVRPEVSPRWLKSPPLKVGVRLMTEGFNESPKVRPTARKVKNDLAAALKMTKKRSVVAPTVPDVIQMDLDLPMGKKCPSSSGVSSANSSYKKDHLSSRMSSSSTSSLIKTAHTIIPQPANQGPDLVCPANYAMT